MIAQATEVVFRDHFDVVAGQIPLEGGAGEPVVVRKRRS